MIWESQLYSREWSNRHRPFHVDSLLFVSLALAIMAASDPEDQVFQEDDDPDPEFERKMEESYAVLPT